MSTDNAWKPANIKSISVQKRGKNEKKKNDGSSSCSTDDMLCIYTGQYAVKADDDVVKLKIWVFGEGSTEECEKVSEALSEITREKIGAEVEIYQTIDTEKLNLAMTSGRKT